MIFCFSFMSTLITNVLTYHLGWVNSVSPYNAPLTIQQKELDYLNTSHPYNPLWAQIGELYGAIGTPARISKTFIYSRRNSSAVNRILNVLSYFIRCGEVKRFDVDSKQLSWETIDLLMEKPESPVETVCPKLDSDYTDSGDYIEMSTFSLNDTSINLQRNKSKIETCSMNLDENHQNPLLSESLSECNVPKDKSSLKRTKSCVTKLQNSHQNSYFDFSKSSLSSISTLVPYTEDSSSDKISDKCSIISNNNDCDFCTSVNNVNINNKMSKLHRVSTSKTLNNVQIKYDLSSINAKNHLNVPISSKYSKISESDNNMFNSLDINLVNCNPINSISSENTHSTGKCDAATEKAVESGSKKRDVLFVLGEDEALIGLKSDNAKFDDSGNSSELNTPNTSSMNVQNAAFNSNSIIEREFTRSRSCPEEMPHNPSIQSIIINSLQSDACCVQKPQCKHSKSKKHSGVKFEFDKYPQIVTNYMKSKNLELLDRHVIGKPGNLKIDGFELEGSSGLIPAQNECDTCISCSQNTQILQTPSNASELEYTSDMPSSDCEIQYAQEKLVLPLIVEPERVEPLPKIYVRTKLENTLVINWSDDHQSSNSRVKSSSSKCSQFKVNGEIDKNIHEEKIELPIPL